jgi:AcrR family transcriptional regulator
MKERVSSDRSTAELSGRKRHASAKSAVMPAASDKPVNFRVRVARERRARMRVRLLSATMDVCAMANSQGPAVIDDVIRAARVSRGTFYKHFDSLEQALAELGAQLADETVEGLRVMYEKVDDPLKRTASGPQLMMIHAIVDPIWGRFVAHTDHLTSESAFSSAIRENTIVGRERGIFTYSSLEAAIDLQFGSTREGVRHMITTRSDRKSYIHDLCVMNLMSLGVVRKRAIAAVRNAAEDIMVRGPVSLPWWKPFS